MENEEPCSTVAQDEWEEIAGSVREQLRKQIPLMQAMKPGELCDLIEAMRKARWLEEDAKTFDIDVEMKLTKWRQD